ncbi:MAG: PH domain-containing protein [Acidobacteria bacterium]|nr:PH domain-containing protein [Acidobacteriota bacterium]
MTSSEQRLHPASILFDTARYARLFLWPALLAFFGAGRRRDPEFGPFDPGDFEVWLWILVLPSVALSVARYLSFRLRYEPNELIIRSGILFRNERHLPYARIQNLDAVQNVFHRALGVVDVRVETGGGTEPEARMSVLPIAALGEMRARVFAGRAVPPEGRDDAMARRDDAMERRDFSPGEPPETDRPTRPEAAPTPTGAHEPETPPSPTGAHRLETPPTPPDAHRPEAGPVPLLHLPLRELLLCGFLENKGVVLVGAAYGALWESGAMNRVWSWLFAGTIDARGLIREVLAFVVGSGPLPTGRLVLLLGGIAGFLVLVRLISMVWAFVRLYDFRLTRRGQDLRITYGLFTRVTATIPVGRIQTLTVHQGWLHRRFRRASIRVETAGGKAGAAVRDREWVAPLIREEHVPALVSAIVPGVAMEAVPWQPVHPRAFRRAVKRSLAAVSLASAVVLLALGPRALVIVLPLVGWTIVSTHQQVKRLRWSATDDVVAFRSGWLRRSETLVRVNRIQAVSVYATPLDRRARMARVRVDTAGAGELSHRVDIPYLAADLARDVADRLAGLAARTAFRW